MTACEWCGAGSPVDFDWAWLMTPGSNAAEDALAFCHAGCLVHWLFSEVPDYFEEVTGMGEGVTLDEVRQSALAALKKALDSGDADMTHAAANAMDRLEALPRG